MKTHTFKDKRRNSYLLAAALLAGAAVSVAACFFVWQLFSFVLMFLGYGVALLVINRRTKKSMDAFGMDDLTIQRAEEELQGAWARHFGNVSMTSNWVIDRSVTGPALFPLRAVTSYQRGYARRRYGGNHYVKLTLTDGKTHKLGCKSTRIGELTALLAYWCPWAAALPGVAFW